MDSVQREFVGKRLRAQQSTQEFVHLGLSQPVDVFGANLERERSIGYGTARRRSVQSRECVWMGVQYAKQVDDAGRGPHGAGFVLAEGSGTATDDFASLGLRHA